MLRVSALLMAGLVVCGCNGRQRPAAPPSSGSPVDDFVQVLYPHGVPYAEARALGSAAEPRLRQLLDLPAMAPHRSNIVITLGMLGSGASVDRLIQLIETGNGILSAEEVSLRMDAVMALGYAAYADPNRTTKALAYLLEGADLARWPPRVHWKLDRGGDAGPRLRDRAIGGLGLSAQPEALRKLQAMQTGGGGGGGRGGPPPTPAEQARLAEAIKANQYIAANGMNKYYEFVVR